MSGVVTSVSFDSYPEGREEASFFAYGGARMHSKLLIGLAESVSNLNADAMRYRWIRDTPFVAYLTLNATFGVSLAAAGADDLDKAIDAAICEAEEYAKDTEAKAAKEIL